jgi:FixJ family two-component response regulator
MSPQHSATLDRPARQTPLGAVAPLVHVVDDDTAIQALFRSMGRTAGFAVVTYGSVGDFLNAWDENQPGCLVLDLNLPDRTGLELLRELAERRCQTPVVFMSGMASVGEAVKALKLGSVDFLEKPFDLQEMIDTIARALATDAARRDNQRNDGDLRRRFERLSLREREVMELVVAGAANKEVAARLGLSPKTVEVHRANVMRKTEANSLAELVRMNLALQN